MSICKHCNKCADVCSFNAMTRIDSKYSVSDIIDICKRDIPFYKKSGGGVTLSGGEPFLQGDFTLALLRELKSVGISTAVETTGYVKSDILCDSGTDLFLYDFKCFDEDMHIRFTGVSNRIIKENLSLLRSSGRNVTVRMPLIPSLNMDDDMLYSTGKFFEDIGIEHVNLLPYHTFGVGKYISLWRCYPLPALKSPSEGDILHVSEIIGSFVPDVSIL